MIDARSAVVIAVALAACIWDVRTGRIPNALTFGAAAAALLFSLFHGGLAGLGWSAAGWLTAAVLFFPIFALRGMGGGDVKLLAALGAWLGGLDVLYLALYTALAGGVMALAAIVSRGYVREAFRNLWLMLSVWLTAGFRAVPGVTLETSRGPRLAYAVPIAAGAVTTLWLR